MLWKLDDTSLWIDQRKSRTSNAIERMQLEFRRRVKTQAALPNEGSVLRVFFGLWVSGQMKLRRIKGYRDIGGKEQIALLKRIS
jgi:putative transposase